MRLGARNRLAGTVKSITFGTVMAEVVVRLGGGDEITAAITDASARSLGLAEGGPATVIVKATEVMIGVEE